MLRRTTLGQRVVIREVLYQLAVFLDWDPLFFPGEAKRRAARRDMMLAMRRPAPRLVSCESTGVLMASAAVRLRRVAIPPPVDDSLRRARLSLRRHALYDSKRREYILSDGTRVPKDVFDAVVDR